MSSNLKNQYRFLFTNQNNIKLQNTNVDKQFIVLKYCKKPKYIFF